MDQAIIVAFVTGLTAGGLSCFAVQGGLLTASIAQRLEARVGRTAAQPGLAGRRAQPVSGFSLRMIQPILLFTLGKLFAYTVLGFLLGLLGSVFSFTPFWKGVVQILVGVFLVGNALRMLNVHPIFRFFSFEPPSSVTRLLRRVSKRSENWLSPLTLGLMTILVPCGVTQSMMAVAIGAGDPILGAAIMFAFVLGTSPAFIGVSWLAASLGTLFQKYFYPIVAVIVLGLGLYAVDGGLKLVGSPVSSARLMQLMHGSAPVLVSAPPAATAPALTQPTLAPPTDFPPAIVPPAAAPAAAAPQEPAPAPASPPVVPSEPPAQETARIDVLDYGYSPDNLVLPASKPIELHLVTDGTQSCSRAFVIPDLDLQQILPETGDTVVMLPAQPAGTRMDFMCSMGMFTGVFNFQ